MSQEIRELSFLTNDVEFATHLTYDKDAFIHSHSFYEIFYITEGRIIHIQNGQKSVLQTGDMFLLRPNDIHTFERVGECTHRDIIFSKDLFEKGANYLSPTLFNEINSRVSPFHLKITPEQISYLESLLNFTKYMSPSVEKNKPYLVNSVLAHLLGYLYISDQEEKIPYPRWFQTFLANLNDPVHIKAGIQSAMTDINYNYIYVSRMFKKYIGVTVSDYLTQKRMELAQIYLSTTKMNISKISEEVGYPYSYRFNQVFKQYTGMTPKEYRKKNSKPS
ncbi:MAG: helix-turn-helix domain-containing protein [Clostridiales bacterium]|nr:helix-turn-helix domain-containing protein [Clostridiales bacterium]